MFSNLLKEEENELFCLDLQVAKRQPERAMIGTSLVVQWLRIHLPMQGTWVRSLIGELRSHMPQGN